MDKFQAMRVFCRVYEAESFKSASETLDISRPMVTRYINTLEEVLGVKLLQRNTRNISITHAGNLYYKHCVAILEALEEAENELNDLSNSPRGRLKVSVPMDFGLSHMVPIFNEFRKLYPDIRIDVDFNDRRVDLTESGVDIAVRGGDLGGDLFVARPLTEFKGHVCASPEYLKTYGEPNVPQDLIEHNCLLYSLAPSPNKWTFIDSKNDEFDVLVSGTFAANNGGALTRMALEGAGIIYQPDFLVDKYIQSGQLVPILTNFRGYIGKFHAVYTQRRLLPKPTRLLLEFMIEKLRAA
ncbi:LysR family transcriptional regulator [Marinomonas mediterranea]|jgi:Transcriptional regulator|uniref:Transcriptional regulator, LysR family n=1 Tax=Marinomonas mediterranea (strain ATCC 700492 / JCM 21426 / NBRC 103028 / MMB-1) TaxID=717774 RepID=F2K473_MARM1|nr:LysR family transcriptional regulator [Marinomonas mediterranea]ADZ92514.1 transcriptional regulator, LysR family [Marinomonas mediterranea MMB-1]WCN10460.1 LysR family transcriptional regulator [Marinomonas mediterranea]WCN14508.1 LysR family transcriptional regulator [Marinomonas mediterranea]WCN18559.1 LysR family transcriptional regulator [Marinomonas mediterranea MMB-1]